METSRSIDNLRATHWADVQHGPLACRPLIAHNPCFGWGIHNIQRKQVSMKKPFQTAQEDFPIKRGWRPVLAIATFVLTACTPWFLGSPPPEDKDNLEVFISEGNILVANIGGQNLSIVLDPDLVLDTSDVAVTVVDLGSIYLLETADLEGRYLPTVQLVGVGESANNQLFAPQVDAAMGLSMRPTKTRDLRVLRGQYLGTVEFSGLADFLAQRIYGESINLLIDLPDADENLSRVRIYQAPGTLNFLLLPDSSSNGETINPNEDEEKLATISVRADFLTSWDPNAVLQQALALPDDVQYAMAEAEVIIPETSAEETPTEPALVVVEPPPTFTPAEPTAPQPTIEPTQLPPTPTLAPPTATLVPPTPTPTEPPVIYTDTFPEVNAGILGSCPAWVHDSYIAIGPDGKTYRTWHPITVPVDIADPNGEQCSFAHEHGDPPHPKAPPPYFGIAAFQAEKYHIIADHQSFKVFTHKVGQLTGWDTPEMIKINPDLDMQFWVHMGTSGRGRLSEEHHDVGFWTVDSIGRETEVYYLANTGSLADKCHGSENETQRRVASECDYAYEIWDFGGTVADAWTSPVQVTVVNPMTFLRGNTQDLGALELLSTSEQICGVNFFPCMYKLPFGHASSFWMGNMRMLNEPNWRWTNGGGRESFCTDAYGSLVQDEFCQGKQQGYIIQRVPPINFFGGSSEVWDRSSSVISDALRLPLGAPAGN
jgi:hypothetical protein